jgi:hypothetical protein
MVGRPIIITEIGGKWFWRNVPDALRPEFRALTLTRQNNPTDIEGLYSGGDECRIEMGTEIAPIPSRA